MSSPGARMPVQQKTRTNDEISTTSSPTHDTLVDPLETSSLVGMNKRNDKKQDMESGGKESLAVLGSQVLGTTTETTVSHETNLDQSTTQDLGSGVRTGVLGLAKFGDSVKTMYSGHKKKNEGKKFGDKGLVTLGDKSIKSGRSGVVSGGVGLTSTTLDLLSGVGELSKIGTSVIPGLNVVGDVVKGGLSGRDVVKQVRRLQGLGKTDMSCSDGERWKEQMGKRIETKKRLSAFQVAMAGLGIAGTLVGLLSNPVGWIVGAVGILGGGGYALYKLGKGMQNKHKTSELTKQKRMVDRAFPESNENTNKGLSEDHGLLDMSELIVNHLSLGNGKQRAIHKDGTLHDDGDDDMDTVLQMLDRDRSDPSMKDPRRNKKNTRFDHLYQSTETEEPKKKKQKKQKKKKKSFREWVDDRRREFDEGLNGTSSGTKLQEDTKPKIDKKKRKELKKEADEIQRMVTEMAALAGELHDALLKGRESYLSETDTLDGERPPTLSAPSKRYQDALALVGILGVTYEEAVSDSGQQLLERKLALR